MASKTIKGHAFDFENDKCLLCGMTLSRFEDNGEPPCAGGRLQVEHDEASERQHMPDEEDTESGDEP